MDIKPSSSSIPLYHGTSTIFVDGIIETGLGGKNQLAEWRAFELAAILHPLVRDILSADPDWMVRAQEFVWMVEQRSGCLNFQHGDTYLSPFSGTAIRYASNKRYGSELLTYILDFLQELLRRKVPGIADDLYRKFPQIFNLLDVSCAPLLVKVEDVTVDELMAESGEDAAQTFDHVLITLCEQPDLAMILLQQSNFRLQKPIPVSRLTISLVNVTEWHPAFPKYSLHMLSIHGNQHTSMLG